MLIETLKTLFERDLKRLRNEIVSYKQESNLWRIQADISNSAGNLCLHLLGNLNNYIGGVIGETGYIRNRELEFSLKNVSRQELLSKIDEAILMINDSLDRLTEADLSHDFPIVVFDQPTSMEYMLVHLTTHLSYHLGQINYQRRLLD